MSVHSPPALCNSRRLGSAPARIGGGRPVAPGAKAFKKKGMIICPVKIARPWLGNHAPGWSSLPGWCPVAFPQPEAHSPFVSRDAGGLQGEFLTLSWIYKYIGFSDYWSDNAYQISKDFDHQGRFSIRVESALFTNSKKCKLQERIVLQHEKICFETSHRIVGPPGDAKRVVRPFLGINYNLYI